MRREKTSFKPRFCHRHRTRSASVKFLAGVILFFCLGTCAFEAFAAPVTRDQAETAVNKWLAQKARPLDAEIGTHIKSTKTVKDATGHTLYHLHYLSKTGTDTTGFVIASGDDTAEPIVAFGSGDRVDENSPLAKILAHDMARRLAATSKASSSKLKMAQSAPTAIAKAKWDGLLITSGSSSFTPPDSLSTPSDLRVAPLVHSTWDQGTINTNSTTVDCYNYFTPGPGGWVAGATNNYVCGCVATALAQVMRYYQWPATGVGKGSYYIYVTDYPTVASFRGGDGNGGAYVWSSMPLNPQTSNPTVTQCQAIGNLTRDAGIGAEMDYNAGGSGQSAADLYNFDYYGEVLSTFFSYKNAILSVSTYNIGSPLITMINPNLDAGFPVILSISSATDAHCIVCDGYGYNAGTIYHHLNMGWSGQNDVWYALPDINVPGDDFNEVNECDYNIYTSGTGEIISGRVIDNGGGPVSGVVVSCISGGKTITSSTTGTTGVYALAKIPPSTTYTVTATSAKFSFASQSVPVGLSQTFNGTTDNPQTGNVWGVNFSPASQPVGVPSFGADSSTIQLSNGSCTSLGNTLCTIQAAVYANITVLLSASGSPISYSATNLPPGLVISPATGQISGTPTQGGLYSTIVTATNATGQGSGMLTFNITYPFILNSSTITGTGGFSLAYQVATSNTAASFSITGLPSGLSISSTTGLISGVTATTGTFMTSITANTLIPGMFSFADGITLDGSGNICVTDYNSNTVRKVNGGLVSTIAGSPGVTGSANGPALMASFNGPNGIGFDKSGNLFITDFGNNTIRKLSPTGTMSTFAGTPGVTGSLNGIGSAAQFNCPNKLILDGTGNIYVADSGNDAIRKITTGGSVSTFAGLPGVTGSANGTGTSARFNWPHSLALDVSGNLYVSDCYNQTIRKITPAGLVSTLAGASGISGSSNGAGITARFNYPEGLAVDSTGNIYVADSQNYTIRAITPGGSVTTLAGAPGVSGTVDGIGSAARFFGPDGMVGDGNGNLYVADTYAIRKVVISTGAVTTVAGVPGVDGTNDSIFPTTSNLTITILPPTAYQSWETTWFGSNPSPTMTANTTLNNSAGISNLLCYSLGMNPLTAQVGGLPKPGTILISNSNYFTLSFTRNGVATDVVYTVQATNDMTNPGGWVTISTFSGGVWSPSYNVTETGTSPAINVRVQDIVPMNTSSHRFMRLQITR